VAKNDDRDAWTIDSPLEEIILEMVNYPPSEGDVVNTSPQLTHSDAGKNGSPNSPRAKAPKKKLNRRRKS
jgi:hypothetical protein